MKRLPAAICASVAAIAFCAAPDAPAPLEIGASLEPAQSLERCLRLEAGEKRAYYWKSNAPVDFNIHFSRGDETRYALKRERMRGDGGTFVAKSAEDYCWTWTAKSAAKLEGRIDVK